MPEPRGAGRRRKLEAAHASATAFLLAAFHATAAAAAPERRRLSALEATLDENVVTLRDAGTGMIDGADSTPPNTSPARSSTPDETSSSRVYAPDWCATVTATCALST